MRKILFYLFAAIIIFSFMITGCKKKDNSSGPSEPGESATVTITASVLLTETATLTRTVSFTPTSTPVLTSTFTGTITATNTVSPTFTITPDSGSKLYTFEVDNEGWGTEGPAALISCDRSTAAHHGGAASLDLNCSFTSANTIVSVYQTYYDPLGLKGKTFSMWVYVPAAIGAASPAYKTKLWITDNLTGWYSVDGQDLTGSNTWQNITMSIPDSLADYDFIYRVVFWIYKGGTSTPDWAGDIYVDDISW